MEAEHRSSRRHLADALLSIKSLVDRIETEDKEAERSLRDEVEALKRESNEATRKCSLLQRQLDETHVKLKLMEASKKSQARSILPPRPEKGTTRLPAIQASSISDNSRNPSPKNMHSPHLPLTSDAHLLMHLMSHLACRSASMHTDPPSSSQGSGQRVHHAASTSSLVSAPELDKNSPLGRMQSSPWSNPPARNDSTQKAGQNGHTSLDLPGCGSLDTAASSSSAVGFPPLSSSLSQSQPPLPPSPHAGSRQATSSLMSMLIAALMVEQQQHEEEKRGIPVVPRPSSSSVSGPSSSDTSVWQSSPRGRMNSHTGGLTNTKGLASVSLEDNQGSYGVGVAAAAAVSALNARAWATKAESSQNHALKRRSVSGHTSSGQLTQETSDSEVSRIPSKAGFRLVASINSISSPLKQATILESDAHEKDDNADSDIVDPVDSNSIEPSNIRSYHGNRDDSFSFPDIDALEVLDHEVERGSSASERRDFTGLERSPFSRLNVKSRASFNSRNSANSRSSHPSLLLPLNQITRSSASGVKADGPALLSTLSQVGSGGGGSPSVMKKSSSFKLSKAPPQGHLQSQSSLSSLHGSMSRMPAIVENLFDVHGDPICKWQTSLTSALESGNVDDSSAIGSTLTLEWITPPRTALVVCKLATHLWPCFLDVLQWMRMHGIIAWIEPAMWKVAVDAGATQGLSEDEMALFVPPRAACANMDGGRKEAAAEEHKEVPVRTWTSRSACSEEGGSIPDSVVENLDFAVVLGGDGTLLWTCHIFGNRAVPPVLPFNMGSLGFLTPFDPSEINLRLGQVTDGGFPMILRHRLHCVIMRASSLSEGGGKGLKDSTWEDGRCENEKVILNEVVVDRGTAPYLANIEAFCDGNFVTRVQGDGLIISTPTGSTAYNLAAGGSILHPQVPGILFTPICPHSLSFRPLIFPDHVQLCIQVPADGRSQLWCSFDGKDRKALGPGDAIIIRMSEWPIPTVSSLDPSRDWFMGVRKGLHWNERRPQAGAGK